MGRPLGDPALADDDPSTTKQNLAGNSFDEVRANVCLPKKHYILRAAWCKLSDLNGDQSAVKLNGVSLMLPKKIRSLFSSKKSEHETKPSNSSNELNNADTIYRKIEYFGTLKKNELASALSSYVLPASAIALAKEATEGISHGSNSPVATLYYKLRLRPFAEISVLIDEICKTVSSLHVPEAHIEMIISGGILSQGSGGIVQTLVDEEALAPLRAITPAVAASFKSISTGPDTIFFEIKITSSVHFHSLFYRPIMIFLKTLENDLEAIAAFKQAENSNIEQDARFSSRYYSIVNAIARSVYAVPSGIDRTMTRPNDDPVLMLEGSHSCFFLGSPPTEQELTELFPKIMALREMLEDNPSSVERANRFFGGHMV